MTDNMTLGFKMKNQDDVVTTALYAGKCMRTHDEYIESNNSCTQRSQRISLRRNERQEISQTIYGTRLKLLEKLSFVCLTKNIRSKREDSRGDRNGPTHVGFILSAVKAKCD